MNLKLTKFNKVTEKDVEEILNMNYTDDRNEFIELINNDNFSNDLQYLTYNLNIDFSYNNEITATISEVKFYYPYIGNCIDNDNFASHKIANMFFSVDTPYSKIAEWANGEFERIKSEINTK
ncbi:Uncharacterised protein [Campylobacter insulaenigrae]|nr:Uncharacterised protein [Campylobacter insulaenigrae]